MKLAFCLYKYFPYGGLQRDFLAIAKIARDGNEVHVFTSSWDGEIPKGFVVHFIKCPGLQNHTRNRAFGERLANTLPHYKFDLIIGFNKMPGLDVYYAADVCFQARKPPNFLRRLLPRYRQHCRFEAAVFSPESVTEILLIAKNQQSEFQKFYHTQSERFHLLTPGISRDRIAPANADAIRHNLRANLKLNADTFLLLMVGSGFKTKGVDRALLALASLPDDIKNSCQLMIIGQDNPKTFLQLADKLSIAQQVKFLGGRNDVSQFLLAADGLIHPAYHENTGTVLLEALVAGLPVLTTDVCGYAHYISEVNAGIVIPSPFEQKNLNDTLQKFITSADRATWKSNALAYAQSADIYNMPDKVLVLLRTFFHKKKTSEVLPSFKEMMQLSGKEYRNLEGRITQKVHLNNTSYFLKKHYGIGWKEFLKNIFQYKLPIISARNEFLALNKLQELGVLAPKVIAFSQQGKNPVRLQSYILLEDIAPSISLEEVLPLLPTLKNKQQFKIKLITKIATIARTLHTNQINHRDFYICHFLLKIPATNFNLDELNVDDLALYLIDLHRAKIWKKLPERWIIKDLAGLYFSCKGEDIKPRDLLRFIKLYFNEPLRSILKKHAALLLKIKSRGDKLYLEHSH